MKRRNQFVIDGLKSKISINFKNSHESTFSAYSLLDSKYSKAAQIEEHLNNYAEQNEISKGKLMQPLRWVVSGQAGGPPIFDMLELIGIDEIKRRMDVVNEKF